MPTLQFRMFKIMGKLQARMDYRYALSQGLSHEEACEVAKDTVEVLRDIKLLKKTRKTYQLRRSNWFEAYGAELEYKRLCSTA